MTDSILLRETVDAMQNACVMPAQLLTTGEAMDIASRTVSVWGAALFRSSSVALAELSKWCAVEDPSRVDTYISLYPFLEPVLAETKRRVSSLFGAFDAVARLDRSISSDRLPVLFIKVRSQLAASDAVQKLDEFDYSWWLDQPHDIRSRLVVTLG